MTPSRFGLARGALVALLLLPLDIVGQQPATQGQEVRGAVSEGGTMAPIEGAMVLLLDARGERVTGVLSGVNGRFRVAVPTPGRYTLRVDRIGYGSMDTEPFEVLAGASVEQRVVTTVKPIQLEGIDVKGSSQCRIRPADGIATHTVWEEARKALDATSFTAERVPYSFTWAQYTRQLDKTERITSEKRSAARGVTSQPFAAAEPDMLREVGYVEQLPDGSLQYWAPDAKVLLSDSFLDTHCFSLRRDVRDGVAVLGLAFEPSSAQGPADVAGVLWIDQATAQLRDLEYYYANLPDALRNQNAGGDLSFASLPNGTWIVKEWNIKMPVIAEVRGGMPRGSGINGISSNGGLGTTRFEVQGWIAEGGVVQRATSRGGEVVLDELNGGIRGAVVDGAGDPVGGVKVRVSGTSFESTTDAQGSFAFPGVGAGTWNVAVVPLELEMAGLEGPGQSVKVGARGMITVRLPLPTVAQTLAAACRETPPGPGFGVVAGRVMDETNSPVPGAEVRLTWRTVAGSAAALNYQTTTESILSDERGGFTFCSVPEDEALTMQGFLDGRLAGETKVQLRFGSGGALVPMFVRTQIEAGR